MCIQWGAMPQQELSYSLSQPATLNRCVQVAGPCPRGRALHTGFISWNSARLISTSKDTGGEDLTVTVTGRDDNK